LAPCTAPSRFAIGPTDFLLDGERLQILLADAMLDSAAPKDVVGRKW
jgi:hypothetical protein